MKGRVIPAFFMKWRSLTLVGLLLLCGCSNSFRYSQTKIAGVSRGVILLHGLRSSSYIWKKLEPALTAQNYAVIKVDYPSSRFTIEQLAPTAIGEAVTRCRTMGIDSIYFVGHSMGNILLRYYLDHYQVPELQRIVMICPPNQGSEMVDRFEKVPGFALINGPAGMQLGTKPDGFVKSLGEPPCEFGVIAATKSWNWIASMFIPGPDDGRVSVENAKLDGMVDFATVKASHHFVTRNETAIAKVVHFLNYGSFDENYQ